MELRALSERISYIPASEQPLSADVGVIRGDRYVWLFDVGNDAAAADAVQGLGKEKMVVLSHFHADHAGNLGRISYGEMYCGAYTRRRLGCGTEVRAPVTFEDGARLTIFPIPSVHAKGMLGLEADGEYAFLGDAVYGAQGRVGEMYNVSLLKETITALERLRARTFLLSHDPSFARPGDQVIAELKELYSRRKPGEAYIFSGE